MDFDDRFDPEEFKKHLRSLDLSDYTEQTSFEELLARTTKNTRRAAEFSFKPVELRVGDTQGFIGKGGTFYPRFQAEVDPQILNPLVVKTGATSLKSSVWIRYSDNERVSTNGMLYDCKFIFETSNSCLDVLVRINRVLEPGRSWV